MPAFPIITLNEAACSEVTGSLFRKGSFFVSGDQISISLSLTVSLRDSSSQDSIDSFHPRAGILWSLTLSMRDVFQLQQLEADARILLDWGLYFSLLFIALFTRLKFSF